MNKKTYEKISNPIKNHPYGVRILNITNKLTTTFVYLTYPFFLLKLAIERDLRFWKILIIPMISFILVSIFRSYKNAPRPYEVLDIEQIISKDTKGNSFPSRHVFSIFVIGMTLFYVSNPVGIILMITGLVVSVVRVVGGVHFPKDVAAGAVIGILSGIIGWNLII